MLATYSDRTRKLSLPYTLVWQPNNLVQPVTAEFELVSGNPVRFALTEVSNTNSADGLHVTIFDVGSTRLFLPQIDTFLGGIWQRHSATLDVVPGKPGFQIQLEHSR